MISGILAWLNHRHSFYRLKYRLWYWGARLLHILVSILLTLLSQQVAIVSTIGHFESPIDVFKRLRPGSVAFVPQLPSCQDIIILAVLFGALALFLWGLWKRFSDFAVMKTFRPLSRDLPAQSRALKVLLSSLLDAPPPTDICPSRHDENLNKIKFDCTTSVLSAKAFFTMKVDPETIALCFNDLFRQSGSDSSLGEIRRIVACSTLTPKEWLNAPLVSYLLATLGLEPTRGLGTSAHKCRYYYLGSSNLDEHDRELLELLEKIHKMFGFTFKAVSPSDLNPIVEYQREKYGVLTPDPAFLFVEGAKQALFYRIAFPKEHRGPYPKVWADETWDPNNSSNASVQVYKSVIDQLCPLPNGRTHTIRSTSEMTPPSP